MPTRLEKNLQHAKAAYLFAINSLPFPKDFPIRVNGMEFSKKSQIDSMEIEFGWSFFCRYEACLESFLKSKNIQLSKKLSLHDWFIKNNVEFNESFAQLIGREMAFEYFKYDNRKIEMLNISEQKNEKLLSKISELSAELSKKYLAKTFDYKKTLLGFQKEIFTPAIKKIHTMTTH